MALCVHLVAMLCVCVLCVGACWEGVCVVCRCMLGGCIVLCVDVCGCMLGGCVVLCVGVCGCEKACVHEIRHALIRQYKHCQPPVHAKAYHSLFATSVIYQTVHEFQGREI